MKPVLARMRSDHSWAAVGNDWLDLRWGSPATLEATHLGYPPLAEMLG